MSPWTREQILVIVGIVVAAVVGIGAAISSYMSNNQNNQVQAKRDEQQKQEQTEQAKPKIAYMSVRYENGYTILTFKNESPVTTVAVSQFDFEITDAQTLAEIEQFDPKPEEMKATARNTLDDVGFIAGVWSRDGKAYIFSKNVGINIPPGHPNDLRLSIINPMWSGKRFAGDFTVSFSGGSSHVIDTYKLGNVTIVPKSKP